MKRSSHLDAVKLEPKAYDLEGGFMPDFSPYRMLQLGVFGGAYFAAAKPRDFKGLQPRTAKLAKLNVGPFDTYHNCFGVAAGLSYAEWYERGWMHNDDPLGWFHWYCRYYAGRRHEDDARQINRWQKYKQRWGDRARSQLYSTGRISSVIMQGLLQWSIDPFVGE